MSAERCLITTNPCGTDTWVVGDCCSCANCRRFMVAQANEAIRMCAELARELSASQADVVSLKVKVPELQVRNENIHAAKEVLVSDVTRLAAELAESEKCAATWWDNWHAARAELSESVRALAVSQGEVASLRRETDLIATERHRDTFALIAQRDALRGDLERAWELLDRAADLAGDSNADLLLDDIVAFLRPPTPTASPEPDRASPEVTVKENDNAAK